MSRPDLHKQFFASLADPASLPAILEHVPDVFFFVKNSKSVLIAGSCNLRERLGVKTAQDLIGRPDSDFFPAHVVKSFHADDQLVFSTGKTLTNRLEIWYGDQHELTWFLTTKVPLWGKNGRVIGLMGITRRDISRTSYQHETGINTVTAYLNENADRILTTAEVARACRMSQRTLFRKIQQSFGISPYELMLRIRLQKAAEALLRTREKIIEVALAHGFCDQSTFTQHFRKRIGMTPKQFRTRNQIV